MLNDADTGMLCLMPFFQSFISDDFNSLSSFVVMELESVPV